MFASSHSTRLPKAVALLAVVVAIVAPGGHAAARPDAVDRWLHNSATMEGNGAVVIPDFVDRYIANQGGGNRRDLRAPDTRDVAAGYLRDGVDRYLANATGRVQSTAVRPDDRPGVRGPSAFETVTVRAEAEGRFEWVDAGIGAGVAAALMLLLLSTRQLVVHRRRDDASSAFSS